MKETFSTVLISKNEEKSLPHLLASLEEFRDKYAGEVILVDTGSTDKTCEIAREWGCKVYEEGTRFCKVFTTKEISDLQIKMAEIAMVTLSIEPNKNYFQYDLARNYANSLSSNGFIFSPDCDEVVEWQLDRVHSLLPNNDHLVYNFTFAFDAYGNPAVQFQHSKFFRRSMLHWVGKIHEVLQPLEGKNPKPPQFTEDIYLAHHQNPDPRRGNYLPMLEYDVILNPKNDRNCYYLAREYMYSSRYDDAIRMFEYYLSLPTGWHPEQGQAKIHLGDCYRGLGDNDKALQKYHEAMAHDPSRREPFFAAGELFHGQQNWRLSSIYFAAALQVTYHGGFYGTDMSLYKERIHLLQSVNHYYLGEKKEAEEQLLLALEAQPKDELILNNFKFLFDFPPVTIVVPTIDRDTTALEESLKNDKYPGEKEILFVKDVNQDGCPRTTNRGVNSAKYDFVVFLGDDTEVTPHWLTRAMIKYKTTFKDGPGLVALNDGEFHDDWQPKLACHWLSHKDLLKYLVGHQFFTEKIKHYGCDDYLTTQVQRLNRYAYDPLSVIKHTRIADETSNLAAKTIYEDRRIYNELIRELWTA